MRPADALLHVLRDEGVTKVFGNPGTTELPLVDALVDADGVDYVLGVHEGSVVAMADGYARATGRPAFVSLHVAAGLANGLIGLLNASRSRTPLVVVAGQQDRRHLVQDPMLSGDLVGLARSAVKQVFDVRHAHDLPLLLRRAFALAVQPPAGPVFLSVPMDLLAEDVQVEMPARSVIAAQGPASRLDEAVALLKGARDPVIVAGDGVGRDGAVAELVRLAEALGAEVFHQPMADGVDFPTTHPLHAGGLPPSHAGIREALSGHDLVFVVGCHAFTPHHYTPGSPIPDGTRVLQLDPDPAELGRNFAVELGLTGAIRSTVDELAHRLRGARTDWPRASTSSAGRCGRGATPSTGPRWRRTGPRRWPRSPPRTRSPPGSHPTRWWSRRPSRPACTCGPCCASRGRARTCTPSAAGSASASVPPSGPGWATRPVRWSRSWATAARCSGCKGCGAPRGTASPSRSS